MKGKIPRIVPSLPNWALMILLIAAVCAVIAGFLNRTSSTVMYAG
jgi:hypothetical protein